MLLKRIVHLLPESLGSYVPTLEAAGIKTTETLIFTPLPTLCDFVPSVPEHHLDQLIKECIQLTAGSSSDGHAALEEEKGKLRGWEEYGVSGLDELFGEWDGCGTVEVCGPRRVGKSLLALHATLRTLWLNPHTTCHWLDTDGSFAPERAKAVLEEWAVADPTEILSRLIVTPCFRLEPDLYQALSTVRETLEAQDESDRAETSETARIRVLVIDQITSLLKEQLNNINSAGHATMVSIMEDVAELTYTHGLTTFITNGHATSVPTNPLSRFSATAIKPALGTAFTFSSDLTLLVQETGKLFGMVDEGERERVRSAPGLRAVVEVLKSRISPSGRWAVVETNGINLMAVVPPPLEDEVTLRRSAGLPVGEVRPVIGSLAQTLAP